MCFWDLRTAQPQFMLQGHTDAGTWLCACISLIAHCAHPLHGVVLSIDLSPTGGMFATGSGDYTVRLCACILTLTFSHLSSYTYLNPREIRDAAMKDIGAIKNPFSLPSSNSLISGFLVSSRSCSFIHVTFIHSSDGIWAGGNVIHTVQVTI